MQKQQIRPYFHYHCEGQVMTLDSQYSPSGHLLAISFSDGTIAAYSSSRHMNPEEAQKNSSLKYFDSKQLHIYLKLAWSFYDNSILAAGSINKVIKIFHVGQQKIECIRSIQTDFIPVFLCFYPSVKSSFITVGFAGGAIGIYDDKLKKISQINAHKESVNWLSWEFQVQDSQKNKWVNKYYKQFSQIKKNEESLLVSGSSDKAIKLWRLSKDFKLEELYSLQAHSRQIRQVMWKPNYFEDKKIFASCSEDGNVKFWSVTTNGKKYFVQQSYFRTFNGPVYRAQYNHLGTMIAIRYFQSEQEKIETKIFLQQGGILQQQITMNGIQKQHL